MTTTREKEHDLMMDHASASADDTARFENVVDHADGLGLSHILKIVESGIRHLYVRELIELMSEHLPDDYEQLRKEAEDGEFGDPYVVGIPGPGD